MSFTSLLSGEAMGKSGQNGVCWGGSLAGCYKAIRLSGEEHFLYTGSVFEVRKRLEKKD